MANMIHSKHPILTVFTKQPLILAASIIPHNGIDLNYSAASIGFSSGFYLLIELFILFQEDLNKTRFAPVPTVSHHDVSCSKGDGSLYVYHID